ncbi:hypothetical protein AAG570_008850 [Ranatra chinensis]|uniref:DNA-(apurinic or apyrimidinic site) endonuclease n=1 Tax=Ranatra chinensis TaxID=642074 RepID=A0ABD0ZD93_9HEMI
MFKGFRPKASQVLSAYLKQTGEPPWTSYFVKYRNVVNDQFGKSHFNWPVGSSNYHVLRTGCFPYIKYHCTKRPYQDLTLEDSLMGIIKLMNLGIPTLMYGFAATALITHRETVYLPEGEVLIYFLLKTEKKKPAGESEEHEMSESLSEDEDEKPKKSAASKRKVPAKKDKETKDNTKKRGMKQDADEHQPTKKAKGEFVNKIETDLSKLSFDCDKTTNSGDKWNFKISTWNVAGLRAWVKKNGLDFLKHEKPDILCLQETKCSEKKLPPEVNTDGYHKYWLSGEREGYSGVALYSKEKPLNVKYGIGIKEHDSEGRVITAEYDKFYLVTAYVPNAGQGLKTLPKRMKWDPDFRNYLKKLDKEKPVILCGDLNVAHNPIDLANPKTNTKSAGFTQEERDGMTEMLKQGFVDTFRHFYPELSGAYTFWSYFNNARARNTGWRLDYFIVSERLLPQVCDNVIRSQIFGSDHCPITLFMHL